MSVKFMNVKLMKGFEPVINININAMNKMKEYIRQSNLEIGWLGTARREGTMFYIDDVFLFKQEVHATTTEITTEGLSEFAMELMSTSDGIDVWNNMKVWGHSHVNMATSPSGQDDKQIEVFAENEEDFFIRIIANKQNDFRIDLYDFTTGVVYEKLPYSIDYGADNNVIESLYKKIAEIEELISVRINPSKEMVESISSEMDEKVTEKKIINNYTKASNQSWWNDYSDCGYYDKSYGVKKNETKSEKSENNKAFQIFSEMSDTDKFESMNFLEYGSSVGDYLGIELTEAEELDLQLLVEDFCEQNREEYYIYMGYYV